MSFQVLFGAGGLAGWNLLKRTAAQQKQMVAADPVVTRSTAYFRDNIAKTGQAADLVSDYRLLSVTLGAFGLEADVASKAFIRKILESPQSDEKSLVNRLADKRYLRLANAFGYDLGNQTVTSDGFADRITQAYLDREFERRVGEGDQNLRLALNAQRELSQMAGRDSTEDTLWFEVMGNPPLRRVFEQAFGFSSSYGKLPIDRQLAEFKEKAETVFGSSSFDVITTEKGTEKLIQRFLLQSQLSEGMAASSYSIALQLLRN
ncbi:DUF1217 domain-containing protein [Paracoccus sp. M683]|uniref:DUF1217 domain-containing protein n=1 Tax=Paracoccus sp. M683 TaxID=2594268 RepID=UPI00117E32A8|nr:DUF1217 domain-containing protein [Paracoccus sp. M683]TRW96066.1 DUF1217 domain-containing protein [Paracoccus sp. M683]